MTGGLNYIEVIANSNVNEIISISCDMNTFKQYLLNDKLIICKLTIVDEDGIILFSEISSGVSLNALFDNSQSSVLFTGIIVTRYRIFVDSNSNSIAIERV